MANTKQTEFGAEQAITDAAALSQAGDLDAVVARCDQALADSPSVAMLWYLKGDAELKLGRLDAALASLTRAAQVDAESSISRVDIDPRVLRSRILRSQGDALFLLEREREAADVYQASLSVDGSQFKAWQRRGLAVLILGNHAEARRTFEEAARLGDPSGPYLLSLDLLLFAAAPLSEAEHCRNRGIVQRVSTNFAAAIRSLTTAITLNPRDAAAHYERGVARQAAGQLTEAMEDYSAALVITPDNRAYYGDRAALRMQMGDVDGVVADCNVAIALAPRDFIGHLNRGVAKIRLGQLDEAVSDLTIAVEIDPQHPDSFRNRGWAYMEKGDFEQAIEDFTRGITRHRDYPQLYANRGRAYRLNGDYEAAIADLTTAITLEPRLVDPHVDRAAARIHLGDFDGAIADCRAALALDPRCTEASRLLRIATGQR